MTYDQKIKTLTSLSCNDELIKFYKLESNKVMLGVKTSAVSIKDINDKLDEYEGNAEGMPMWFKLSKSYLNDQSGPDAYKFEPNTQK